LRFVEPAVQTGSLLDGKRPQGIVVRVVIDRLLLSGGVQARNGKQAEDQQDLEMSGSIDGVLQCPVLLADLVGMVGRTEPERTCPPAPRSTDFMLDNLPPEILSAIR